MRRRLDDTDSAIVEHLSRDARVSNREIAEALGVTEGTVRARVKRMEEEKQIRLTAVTNIDRFKDAALAYIWVEVERSEQTRKVAEEMEKMDLEGLKLFIEDTFEDRIELEVWR